MACPLPKDPTEQSVFKNIEKYSVDLMWYLLMYLFIRWRGSRNFSTKKGGGLKKCMLIHVIDVYKHEYYSI